MGEPAWHEDEHNRGPAVLAGVRAAVAAPSIHNTQPWLFRLCGDGIDVLVDRRRQLTSLDPEGREMVVSVGAALFNLRVAVRAHGWETRVLLWPEPDMPDLAARVTLGRAAGVRPGVRALAEAIPRRRTNRYPFTDRAVPYGTQVELAGAATAEGADLLTADPPLRAGVLSLTRTAESRMRADPHYRAELAAWTPLPGIDRRDGVPRQAFGPRDEDFALPLRDFTLGHGAPSGMVAFEPDPTIVLLFTADDTPSDWLRAGAALQRILLIGNLRGLAATPLSQLVEVPKLRALLADMVTGQVVQTVLRIGYPTRPAPPTPRRPVRDVILTDTRDRRTT